MSSPIRRARDGLTTPIAAGKYAPQYTAKELLGTVEMVQQRRLRNLAYLQPAAAQTPMSLRSDDCWTTMRPAAADFVSAFPGTAPCSKAPVLLTPDPRMITKRPAAADPDPGAPTQPPQALLPAPAGADSVMPIGTTDNRPKHIRGKRTNIKKLVGGVLGVRPAIVKQSRGMRHKVLVHGAGMKLAAQSKGFQGLAPDAALFLPFDKVNLPLPVAARAPWESAEQVFARMGAINVDFHLNGKAARFGMQMTNSYQTACGATVRLGITFQNTVSIHWIVMEQKYCAGMQPGEVMANTFAFLLQKGVPLRTKGVPYGSSGSFNAKAFALSHVGRSFHGFMHMLRSTARFGKAIKMGVPANAGT